MRSLFPIHSCIPLATFLAWGLTLFSSANAQIFEADHDSGTVGAYDFDGNLISTISIPGLNQPAGMAISGDYLYVVNGGFASNPSVSKYNLSGEPVTPAPVMGLYLGESIAVSGNDLFVTDYLTGTIGEYNATTGQAVNANLISGLSTGSSFAQSIAVVGNQIYVVNSSTDSSATGFINVYDLTADGQASGPTTLVTGLDSPIGIAISGSDIFVAEHSTGVVGEYSLTGKEINASLLYDLVGPSSLAVLGDDLFVGTSDGVTGTIGEYTTSGVPINAHLITDLSQGFQGIAVASLLDGDPPSDPPSGVEVTPEPGTWILVLIGLGCLAAFQSRRRSIATPSNSFAVYGTGYSNIYRIEIVK